MCHDTIIVSNNEFLNGIKFNNLHGIFLNLFF